MVNSGSTSGLSAAEQARVAGALGSNDTIQFDPGLAGGTLTLTGGALNLTRNVTVTGPGAASLTISGNHADRVFRVVSGLTVTLSGLTVAGGNVVSSSTNYGGGLLNSGTLTVNNCTFTNNAAGQAAKATAEFFTAYIFPKASGDPSAPPCPIDGKTMSSIPGMAIPSPTLWECGPRSSDSVVEMSEYCPHPRPATHRLIGRHPPLRRGSVSGGSIHESAALEKD